MAKKKREGVPQIAIAVGNAIAVQRKRAGKTQRQVAEEMETGVETISRLESGSILQTVDRLQQLSDVLDCPITRFFWTESNSIDIQAETIVDMLRVLSAERRMDAICLMTEVIRVLSK